MKSPEVNNFVVTQFSRYGKMVLRIAYQNTGNMAEAEDITQEVFIKLMKETKGFTDEEHSKAWLIRVTINLCKDYFKSARFRKNVAYTEENLSGDYLAMECLNLEDRQVFSELLKLPANYRNVIYLYYVEEYSVPEIAKLLQAKENTVSSWLRRAKKKLKIGMEGVDQYEKGSIYCGNAKN